MFYRAILIPVLHIAIPVVRSSYSDVFYSQLAREAISVVESRRVGEVPITSTFYIYSFFQLRLVVLSFFHAQGLGFWFLVLLRTYPRVLTPTNLMKMTVTIGSRLDVLKMDRPSAPYSPRMVNVASFDRSSGYLNYDGGWAMPLKVFVAWLPASLPRVVSDSRKICR